jgi:hypothetical protein
VRLLVIAPDGDLLRLPFEVLPIGAGWQLIDDEAWQVSYLSAGRDVLRFSRGSPELLGVGSPGGRSLHPDFTQEGAPNESQGAHMKHISEAGMFS